MITLLIIDLVIPNLDSNSSLYLSISNSESISCDVPAQLGSNVRVMEYILGTLDHSEIEQLHQETESAFETVSDVKLEGQDFRTERILDRNFIQLMSWTNSRPNGWRLDLSTRKAAHQHGWVIKTSKAVREQFFPEIVFGGCILSRGVPPVEVAQQGAIIMWRKKKTGGKPIIQYRHTAHFNLKHWNASLWSIMYFHSPIEGEGGSSTRPFEKEPAPAAPSEDSPPHVPDAPSVPPPLPRAPKIPQVPAPRSPPHRRRLT